MKVLLVDDEVRLSETLVEILKKNRYEVDNVYDGQKGLRKALEGSYDVILLDIMLPQINGIKVLKKFRAQDKTTPVILLTARNEVSDRIEGLDYGADDYLQKPFNPDELMARIRAVTRRNGRIKPQSCVMEYGDLTLSVPASKLSTQKGEIILTQKECALMEYLLRSNTVVLPEEKILERIWPDETTREGQVETYISFLRKKLERVKSQVQIIRIRGVGYKICSKD